MMYLGDGRLGWSLHDTILEQVQRDEAFKFAFCSQVFLVTLYCNFLSPLHLDTTTMTFARSQILGLVAVQTHSVDVTCLRVEPCLRAFH